eukprot:1312734-Amorphochlora_amoeboformis.AAC.1
MFSTAFYRPTFVASTYKRRHRRIHPLYGFSSPYSSFDDDSDNEEWLNDFMFLPFRNACVPRRRVVMLVKREPLDQLPPDEEEAASSCDECKQGDCKSAFDDNDSKCGNSTCDCKCNIGLKRKKLLVKTSKTSNISSYDNDNNSHEQKTDNLVSNNFFLKGLHSLRLSEDSTPARSVYILPGVTSAENLQVKVNHGVLSVSAQIEKKSKHGHFSRRFIRSFMLPEGALESKISANIKGGELRITVPKKMEDDKEREIKVTASEEESKDSKANTDVVGSTRVLESPQKRIARPKGEDKIQDQEKTDPTKTACALKADEKVSRPKAEDEHHDQDQDIEKTDAFKSELDAKDDEKSKVTVEDVTEAEAKEAFVVV